MIDYQQLFFANSKQFFLIAGPCAIEGKQICSDIAAELKQLCQKHQIPFIFKASFRKANRSRIDSFTGIGDQKAIDILAAIKEQFSIPITTDVHSVEDVLKVQDIVDIIQIPAFLCRQTQLLVAAAQTGKIVNIKKGQFLSPEAMNFAKQKILDSGNQKVCLTERGTTFGYHDLVVDYRGLQQMAALKAPVILDCTHSLQKPNQIEGVTGGAPRFIETLARAAIAVGVDGLFIETHPDPSSAKSDGANMLPLSSMDNLLRKLSHLRNAVKEL